VINALVQGLKERKVVLNTQMMQKRTAPWLGISDAEDMPAVLQPHMKELTSLMLQLQLPSQIKHNFPNAAKGGHRVNNPPAKIVIT
jgi:hypothetical protein